MGAYCKLVCLNLQVLNRGSTKDNSVFLKGVGKVFIFRQETIARMNRLHVILDTNVDDIINVEILSDGALVSIQLKGLIALVTVLRKAV